MLALLRDGECCQADWQRRLGAGFTPVSNYLEGLAGTVADTYPHPQNGLPLIPRRVYDGTYTARPDDPEVTRVQAVRGIEPAALMRWRLRWEIIGKAVAGALGIESHAGAGPFETPWVQSIGVLRTRDASLDVLLLVARSEVEALGWVRHLLHGGPRVIILSSHASLCADLAAAHGLHYLALDRDTRFVCSEGQWELKALAAFAEFHPKEQPMSWDVHSTEPTGHSAETGASGEPEPDMLTIRQAAEYARLTSRTIYNLLRKINGDGSPLLGGVIGEGRLTRIPRTSLDPYRNPVKVTRKKTRTPPKRTARKAVKRKA